MKMGPDCETTLLSSELSVLRTDYKGVLVSLCSETQACPDGRDKD